MPKLNVRSVRKEGFFRAGKFWPAQVTEVEVDQKTAEILLAEPQLVVIPVPKAKPEPKEEPVKPDPKGKPDPKAE